MNTKNAKVFILKLIIIILAHAMFAVLAWLLGNMLGAFKFDESAADDELLKRTIICAVCGAGFFVYMGKKIQKTLPAAPDRSNQSCAISALFDTAAFASLLVWLPIASIFTTITENALINRLFAPHMLPLYLGLDSILSFLLWLAVYYIISFCVLKFAPPIIPKAAAQIVTPEAEDTRYDDYNSDDTSEDDIDDSGSNETDGNDEDPDTDVDADTDVDDDTDSNE